MTVRNTSEAKAQPPALIEAVQSGKEVIIGRVGKPVASLVLYQKAVPPRLPGALKGRIGIADDFDEFPTDIAEPFGLG